MNLNPPLNFKEQLEKLKEHGMEITNEEEVINKLKIINYYRLTGYAIQFRSNNETKDYIRGTSFDKVYRLYSFDESMRSLIRKYIEKVEVYYKTQIAYEFASVKCTTEPYDQHYR